jgi:hypothetical protein
VILQDSVDRGLLRLLFGHGVERHLLGGREIYEEKRLIQKRPVHCT